MSDYIDFKVVGQVIAVGVLLGAGLPLVFAVGLRSLSTGATATGGDGTSFQVTKNPLALIVAVVCFAVVLAAIAFGIYIITHKS